MCPRLWRVVRSQTPNAAGPSLLARLGLVPPSAEALKDIGIAFTVYHAIKLSEPELAKRSRATRDFAQLAAAAQAHAAIAARMCGRA